MSKKHNRLYDRNHRKVIIHYNRDKNDYESWGIHLWNEKSFALDIDFLDESPDYGKKVEFIVDKKVTSINFLVRKKYWVDRDISETRTIKVNKNSFITEIWIRQLDEALHIDAPPIGPRIRTAIFDNDIDPNTNRQLIKIYLTEETSIFNDFILIDAGKDGTAKKEVLDVVSFKRNELVNAVWLSIPHDYKLDPSHIYYIKSYSYLGDGGKARLVFRGYLCNDSFNYKGEDLGLNYNSLKNLFSFKLWSPTASKVELLIYSTGDQNPRTGKSYIMQKEPHGVWHIDIKENLLGKFYLYNVTNYNISNYAVDPYAKAVCQDGKKAAILDIDKLSNQNKITKLNEKFKNIEDCILYELHVRDFSVDKTSGLSNKGKFLAFTEEGAKITIDGKNYSTGIDHLKELGVTHVHLLPTYDFGSIKEFPIQYDPENIEKHEVSKVFNWGYDPVNYNALEGSYSSNPLNPSARITEFKRLVDALHKKGIGVVLDVVYNHTYTMDCFNNIVPGYFYITNDYGFFIDGTGCGNAFESKRSMARKFIIDSLKHWVNEYDVDGFRFDLAAVLDKETLCEAVKEIKAIKPSTIFYGEPWGGYGFDCRWQKEDMNGTGFAIFNDIFRHALKGDSDDDSKGYISNEGNGERHAKSFKTIIMNGILGSPRFDSFASCPSDTVNYVDAHDNLILIDKIRKSNPEDSNEDHIKMFKLAYSILFLSQGIPFMTAGDEFLRDKCMCQDSYNKPDIVNSIKWDNKHAHHDIFNYFKGLIKLRKEHPAFRMTSHNEIINHFDWINTDIRVDNVIGFILKNSANDDPWNNIIVIFNPHKEYKLIDLPPSDYGSWRIVVYGDEAGTNVIGAKQKFATHSINVPPISTVVLYDYDVNFIPIPKEVKVYKNSNDTTSVIIFDQEGIPIISNLDILSDENKKLTKSFKL